MFNNADHQASLGRGMAGPERLGAADHELPRRMFDTRKPDAADPRSMNWRAGRLYRSRSGWHIC